MGRCTVATTVKCKQRAKALLTLSYILLLFKMSHTHFTRSSYICGPCAIYVAHGPVMCT